MSIVTIHILTDCFVVRGAIGDMVKFYLTLLVAFGVIANAWCANDSAVIEREFPYQISLQEEWPFFNDWSHICGGSIVTTRHVVTAAHCLEPFYPSGLSIFAGNTDLNGRIGKRFMVESFIVHPDYEYLVSSDIGILTTETPIEFNKHVSLDATFDICTLFNMHLYNLDHRIKIHAIQYSPEVIGGGKYVEVTGWGYVEPHRSGTLPLELQLVVLKTITNAECIAGGVKVDDTSLCTRGRSGKGTCGVSRTYPTIVSKIVHFILYIYYLN